MSEIRLFVDAPLGHDVPLELERGQAHYLLSVMRRRAGDPVLLFNGRDGEWRARLTHAAKRAIRLELVEQNRPQQDEPGPVLWFAPLKRARHELLLEKGTELGVKRFCPVLMRRSIVEKVNLERQRKTLIEAAEQCGRLTIPGIEPPVPLDAVVAATAHPTLWADEATADGGDGMPLLDAFRTHPGADLLIGPEGGFDPEERAFLRGAPGVVRVNLGRRILRAETAALAALAVWQASRAS